MLFDAGWPARGSGATSVDRIVEACKAAGVKQIDDLVISHFDIDHIGDPTVSWPQRFPSGISSTMEYLNRPPLPPFPMRAIQLPKKLRNSASKPMMRFALRWATRC